MSTSVLLIFKVMTPGQRIFPPPLALKEQFDFYRSFNKMMLLIRNQQAPINEAIVGKSVPHFSSQIQATGEATYASDTPQFKGKHL